MGGGIPGPLLPLCLALVLWFVNAPSLCADLSLIKLRMLKHQHQTKDTLKALSATEHV